MGATVYSPIYAGYNALAMNSYFAVGLFGVLASLSALIAFVWAARRGQLAASEDVKYVLLAGEDAAPISAPSPRRARWFLAALAAVFAFIMASFLVTLVTAVSAESPAAPASSAVPPAPKCPF